jgi:hypothetical protein
VPAFALLVVLGALYEDRDPVRGPGDIFNAQSDQLCPPAHRFISDQQQGAIAQSSQPAAPCLGLEPSPLGCAEPLPERIVGRPCRNVSGQHAADVLPAQAPSLALAHTEPALGTAQALADFRMGAVEW